MKRPRWRGPLYAALALLYVLHNDFWLWDDPRPVLGLPAGLAYHVVFAVATAAVLGLLAWAAWPEGLEAGVRVPAKPGSPELPTSELNAP